MLLSLFPLMITPDVERVKGEREVKERGLGAAKQHRCRIEVNCLHLNHRLPPSGLEEDDREDD